MDGENEEAKGDASLGPWEHPYPHPSIPTIFVDGVLNASRSHQVTRFYVYREDPSLNADNTSRPSPTAQIVMPTLSFIQTALFFESVLKQMVRDGQADQEVLDRARARLEQG